MHPRALCLAPARRPCVRIRAQILTIEDTFAAGEALPDESQGNVAERRHQRQEHISLCLLLLAPSPLSYLDRVQARVFYKGLLQRPGR